MGFHEGEILAKDVVDVGISRLEGGVGGEGDDDECPDD